MFATEQQQLLDHYHDVYKNCIRPQVDIMEEDQAYILMMDVPGVQKDQVEITLDRNLLTIHAKQQMQDTQKNQDIKYLRQEYDSCDYFRVFRVSNDVIDGQHIEANLNQGVLTVTLNKAEQAKPRKIEITS